MKNVCLVQAFDAPVCNCGTCRYEARLNAKYRPPQKHTTGKTAPPRGRKLRVLDRDEWTCRYCGGEANTVDHVIARSRGGTNAMDNLVAACSSCNIEKGDRLLEEFVAGRS